MRHGWALSKESWATGKAWARVCREAGAHVAENVLLRNMNLQGVSARDGPQLEVVANGLPLWGGAQLFFTLVTAHAEDPALERQVTAPDLD